MKEPSPDKEIILGQVHAESGEPLPPLPIVEAQGAEALHMITVLLNNGMAYREPLIKEGRVAGYFIKQYANPEDPRPSAKDSVLRFEDVSAQLQVDDGNEARDTLVKDLEDSRDTQSNH